MHKSRYLKRFFAISLSLVVAAGHPVMAAETYTNEPATGAVVNSMGDAKAGSTEEPLENAADEELGAGSPKQEGIGTDGAVGENTETEQEQAETESGGELEDGGTAAPEKTEESPSDTDTPAAETADSSGTENAGADEQEKPTQTPAEEQTSEGKQIPAEEQAAEEPSVQKDSSMESLVWEEGGLRYYGGDGTPVQNAFISNGGKDYYFDAEGYGVTGGFEKDGRRYLAGEDCALFCGWQTENGTTVFYGEDHAMVTGSTVETESGTYTFDESGALMECSVSDPSSIPAGYNGKAYINGTVRYYKDGVAATGWYTADGITMYLSEEGTVSYGCTQTDKGLCYFDRETGGIITDSLITDETGTYCAGTDGILKTGVAADSSGRILAFDKDGRMVKEGWFNGDGRRYYIKNDGTAATGWTTVGSREYHFNSNGEMSTGWKTIGGKVYYFFDGQYDFYKPSILGAKASGWKTIGGKKYYFMDSRCKGFRPENQGARASGFKEINGKTYYFLDSRASTLNSSNRGSLANGIIKINGKNTFYFVNGTAMKKEGWISSAGKWYYLKKNGVAASGWTKIKGKWYYMDPATCAKKTGWVKSGKHWYYLCKDGSMKTGWLKSGGRMYYLQKSGALKTGWVKIKGKYYYVLSDRSFQTGWLTSKGKRYYLNKDGSRRTGWLGCNGKLYYFDGSGVLRTGWTKIKNRWFYMNKGGGIKKGVILLGGKVYYFTANGIMKPDYTRNASSLAKLPSKTRPIALRIIKSAIENRCDRNLYSGTLNNKKEYQPMIKAVNDTYFNYVGQVTVGHTFTSGTKNVTDLSIRFSFQTEQNRNWLRKNTEIEKIVSQNFAKATSPGRSASRKVSDITGYICDTFRYDYDAYYNDTATWDTCSTIKKRKGVCWNYAQYFFWMCRKGNIPCRMVTGYANGGSHEWNQVKLGGTWEDIDVCWIDAAGRKYYLSRNGWSDHRFVAVDQSYE